MSKKAHIIRWLKVLMVISMGVLFAVVSVATSMSHKDLVCSAVVVDIDQKGNLHFLDERDVLEILNRDGQLVNRKFSEIDFAELEKALEANGFISNAEIYTNFDGVLKAKIQQKTPKYRIFNNEGVSYYISDSGNYMPLSSKFTPRLLVVTGNVPFARNADDEPVNRGLKSIIDFILEDEFLSAMIGSIYVNSKKEFVLIPKIDGHKIELGKAVDLPAKFRNLKIFYKKALPYSEWEKYETINLKYKGQIVCSKK
jgi:cell division protein FtsQ